MKKKILIVDDENHIVELVKTLLVQEDYEVLVAHDGRQVLSILKKTSPDLILLDIMMPGMSGVQVSEKIRADSKLKSVKIIYLTVVGVSEIEKKNLKKNNIVDYIQKPFDNKMLIAKVKEVLR